MAEVNVRLTPCIAKAAQALMDAWDSEVYNKGKPIRLGELIGNSRLDSFGVQVAILAAALYAEKGSTDVVKLRAEIASLRKYIGLEEAEA